MSSELIGSIAGIILSLLFSYIPKFKSWFEGMDPDKRRLVMLGLLALVPAGVFAANCLSFGETIGIVVPCTQAGAAELARVFIVAMVANQATYAISPGK